MDSSFDHCSSQAWAVTCTRGQTPPKHPRGGVVVRSGACSTADLGVAEWTALLHLYVRPPRSLEERQGEQERPSPAMPTREPSSDGTRGRGDSARSTPKARDPGGPPPYLLWRLWRRRLLGPAVCSAGSWSRGGVRCASGRVGRARTGAAFEAGQAAGRSAVGWMKIGSGLACIVCRA